MGVPGFYRWICQRYPMIRRDFNDPTLPIVNNLYLDINGIIHHAASTSNLQGYDLTPDFLSELYRRIDNQVQLFKPTDLIFISSDGVAPFAKGTQQRERRFVSGEMHVANEVDHCTISPGTEFQIRVHEKLKEFFRKQKKNDLLWSNAHVIYSGVTVPGEGEHKIFNYIRESRNSPDWNPNLVHCVGCGDADLFFLALQSHEPYFVFHKSKDSTYIGKNPQVFDAKPMKDKCSTDDYEAIHVSLIREYLSIDFGVKDKELELTIDDFIALSFLIGNDFIPHIKDIDIYENYDDILNIYKSMRKTSFHLVENNKFNKEFLKVFLSKIVDMLRLRYQKQMKLELPIDEVAKLYTQNNRQYLAERYDDKSDDLDDLIKEMSNSFLDALDWVLKYYSEGCPSWKWYYHYHYAPPLEFVIPFIDEHETSFEEDVPNQPLMQLLAILPPQAKDLLPEELAALMDSDELKEFYPETYKKDINERKVEWQATVLVPMIDLDILEKKFREVNLPEDVLERLNTFEFPIEFKNDDEEEEISLSKGEIPFQPVVLATQHPPFIPTFKNLEFTFEEKIVPVKVFYYTYNKPSIVIKVEREKKNIRDVMSLLNKTVSVNWPYLRPAKVVEIIDEKSIYNGSFVPLKDPKVFSAKSIHDDLLTTKALDLGTISIILTVCYQKSDGSFDTNETFNVPLNLVSTDVIMNFQYEQKNREPEINEKVVFIHSKSSENCAGRIISKEGQNFKVHVIRRNLFNPMITESQKWDKFDFVLKNIGGLSFKGFRQCLRKVIVDPFNVNIAFTLITSDHKVLFGCCKRSEKSYEFAKFILPLLKEYFKRTGNLKKLVMDSISRGEYYLSKVTLEMLYGGTEQHQNECYNELINWLSKYSPAVKYPLVDEDNDFLSCQSIEILEQKVDAFNFNVREESELKSINSSELIWRMKKRQNTNLSMPKIGQRVVSIASSGPALIGETGTIVETKPSSNSVFVLFDRVLMCATRFEGILKTNRGLMVNINDIMIID